MQARSFVRKEADPSDILTAARTIPANNVRTCNWFEHEWVSPEEYLQWARLGSQQPQDEYSLDSAVCYAKRVVCRIIDALILGNHLRYFLSKNYPAKIQALCDIGVSIPPIIHELIIDPRNQLEHDYKRPELKKAEHAVQIAELILKATEEELKRKPIVALRWNILYRCSSSAKGEVVEFNGFSNEPMLFVDVFTEPVEVKIVHPKDVELSFARLECFTKEQSLELTKKLREHYTQTWKSCGESGTGAFFYKEIKRQAGI